MGKTKKPEFLIVVLGIFKLFHIVFVDLFWLAGGGNFRLYFVILCMEYLQELSSKLQMQSPRSWFEPPKGMPCKLAAISVLGTTTFSTMEILPSLRLESLSQIFLSNQHWHNWKASVQESASQGNLRVPENLSKQLSLLLSSLLIKVMLTQ